MEKKSPLKRNPLRHAGQSATEEIDRLINDKFSGYLLFAALFWVVTLIEFVASMFHFPRVPGWYAAVAIISSAVAAYHFVDTRRRVRNLQLGSDGEREVAEVLQELAKDGAEIIHDVPAGNFNIDHVVVSTHGIYAIETKTWRKSKDRSRIEFDGKRVTVSGRPSDYDPIGQCMAQASWMVDFLRRSTSKILPVRPVVAFPDWWVEQLPGARDSHLWVVNPKALVKWIPRQSEILSPSDSHMAALHLRQYVRNFKEFGP